MTMANQQTHEMHEAVREVQTTNRFILKRLNQLISGESKNGQPCTCECHNEEAFKELLTTVNKLEATEKETEVVIHEMSQQIKSLQAHVKELQVHRAASSFPTKYAPPSVETKTEQDFSKLKLIGTREIEGLGMDSFIEETNVPLSVDLSKGKIDSADHNSVMNKTEKQEAEPLNDGAKAADTTPTEHIEFKQSTRGASPCPSTDAKANTEDNSAKVPSTHEIETDQSKEISVKSNEDTPDDTGAGNGDDNGLEIENIDESSIGDSTLQAEMRMKSINKPNFSKPTSSVKMLDSSTGAAAEAVKVVESKVKMSYPSADAWRFFSAQEHSSAAAAGLKELKGVHTVLCIDISASMAKGDGWTHTRIFFNDFISGLEDVAINHGIRNEHVALVTFGHDTRVVQRLTNDFSKLRHAFGNIKLGGPTPMFGGLQIAEAAAGTPERQVDIINGIQVNTKVIMVTDGEPTDSCMYQGPDQCDSNDQDEMKALVLSVLERWQTLECLDFYCVPAGKTANMEFLQLMVAVAEGKMLRPEDGRPFSRRVFLTEKATHGSLGILQSMLGSSEFMIDQQQDLSESDREQLRDIMADAQKSLLRRMSKNDDNDNYYNESDDDNLPSIGSRVRRGPDWQWKEQDSRGPGTVIGHSGRQVWVEWDANKHINVYRYGVGGDYDILVVNEPRTVGPGDKLMVGCVVKPGADFVQGDKKVTSQEKGVVIKVLSSDPQKVQVRWNNRVRGDYSYGANGKSEVELWQPLGMQTYGLTSEKVPIKRTKNKNKNMK